MWIQWFLQVPLLRRPKWPSVFENGRWMKIQWSQTRPAHLRRQNNLQTIFLCYFWVSNLEFDALEVSPPWPLVSNPMAFSLQCLPWRILTPLCLFNRLEFDNCWVSEVTKTHLKQMPPTEKCVDQEHMTQCELDDISCIIGQLSVFAPNLCQKPCSSDK